MPLSIRPYKDRDASQVLERFAAGSRSPWLRLPYPYTVETVLAREAGMQLFVATPSAGHVIGLLGFDLRETPALLLGPLVQDEQLADLYVRALLSHGLGWAREAGIERVRLKIDLGEDRALRLFLDQGFHLLETRDFVLAARRSRRPLPTPIEGIRFGPSPEMLSSDYLRLYQELADEAGWTTREGWTRPQAFEHLQRPDLHLYSARAGETYLGLVELVSDGEGSAELVHFGLLPTFRGRGVGSAFLEHVLHHAFETLNLNRIWVAGEGNPETGPAAFLEKRGFKPDRSLIHLERVFHHAVGSADRAHSPEA